MRAEGARKFLGYFDQNQWFLSSVLALPNLTLNVLIILSPPLFFSGEGETVNTKSKQPCLTPEAIFQIKWIFQRYRDSCGSFWGKNVRQITRNVQKCIRFVDNKSYRQEKDEFVFKIHRELSEHLLYCDLSEPPVHGQ